MPTDLGPCRHCGRHVPVSATQCRFCGFDPDSETGNGRVTESAHRPARVTRVVTALRRRLSAALRSR